MDYNKLFDVQIRDLSRFYEVDGLKRAVKELQEGEDKLIEMWPKDFDNFRDVIMSINSAFEHVITEVFNQLVKKNLITPSRGIQKKIRNNQFVALGEKISEFEKSGLFGEDLIDLLRQYKDKWRNTSTHESKKYSKSEAINALAIASMMIVIFIEQTQRLSEKHFFGWIKDLTAATERVHTLAVKRRRNENDNEVSGAIKEALASISWSDLNEALRYLFWESPEDWKEHVLANRPKSVLGDEDHFSTFSNEVTKTIFRRASLSPEAYDWITEEMANWRGYTLQNETIYEEYSLQKLIQALEHVRNRRSLRIEHLLPVLVITLFAYGDRFPPFQDELSEDGRYLSISKFGQMAGVLVGYVGLQ